MRTNGLLVTLKHGKSWQKMATLTSINLSNKKTPKRKLNVASSELKSSVRAMLTKPCVLGNQNQMPTPKAESESTATSSQRLHQSQRRSQEIRITKTERTR